MFILRFVGGISTKDIAYVYVSKGCTLVLHLYVHWLSDRRYHLLFIGGLGCLLMYTTLVIHWIMLLGMPWECLGVLG